MTDTVLNRGNAAAGAFKIGYYLSTDKVSKTNTLTANRSIVSLAAGASSTGTAALAIPTETALGTYYLLTCADSAGSVSEVDETNNCISSAGTISISIVDLVQTAISNPPASGTIGGSFSVTDTVFNQGNAAAAAFKIGYYLSTDKVSKTNTLRGSRSFTGLPAGASSTGTVTVTIPTETAPGTYYLLACADSAGAVIETDETNNCLSSVGATTIETIKISLLRTNAANPRYFVDDRGEPVFLTGSHT